MIVPHVSLAAQMAKQVGDIIKMDTRIAESYRATRRQKRLRRAAAAATAAAAAGVNIDDDGRSDDDDDDDDDAAEVPVPMVEHLVVGL